MSYQLVICSETKLLVYEKDRELGLERLEKVVFDYLNFHVFGNLLIKLILGQKGIWAVLKVPKCVLSPLVDDLSWYFLVGWQLSSHFDYQILNHFHHVISVFSS